MAYGDRKFWRKYNKTPRRREYLRKLREKNRDKINQQSKKWRENHPNYCKIQRDRSLKWYKNNREKAKNCHIEWVKNNPEKEFRIQRCRSFQIFCKRNGFKINEENKQLWLEKQEQLMMSYASVKHAENHHITVLLNVMIASLYASNRGS